MTDEELQNLMRLLKCDSLDDLEEKLDEIQGDIAILKLERELE